MKRDLGSSRLEQAPLNNAAGLWIKLSGQSRAQSKRPSIKKISFLKNKNPVNAQATSNKLQAGWARPIMYKGPRIIKLDTPEGLGYNGIMFTQRVYAILQ